MADHISTALKLTNNLNKTAAITALNGYCPIETLEDHSPLDLATLSNKGIGAVLVDDPKLLVESLDKVEAGQLVPNIIVLYQEGNLDDMIYAIKLGVYDAIQLPSFSEEIQWVVSKALTDFQLTKKLTDYRNQPLVNDLFIKYKQTLLTHGLPINDAMLKEIFAGKSNHEAVSKISELHLDDTQDIPLLIVEDDPVYVKRYEQLLKNQHYLITFAKSLSDARLALLKNPAFPVVLLDLELGRSSGEELLSEIKMLDQSTEVIIVSGFKDIELILKTIQRGAFDYLVKDNLPKVHKKIIQALQKRALVNLLNKRATPE